MPRDGDSQTTNLSFLSNDPAWFVQESKNQPLK